MEEETAGKSFVLAITSHQDDDGRTLYRAVEFNKGIPIEQVITITRMWLKRIEEKYLEKFYDKESL